MKALLIVFALAGCLRDTEFHCMTSAACGTGGRCEANGFCSVADATCTTGFRYSAYSGVLSNQCTSSSVDAGIDGQGCAPGFLPLPGVPGHLYFIITAPADFTSQRTTCASQGGITYLAIPDNANELQALLTVINQPTIWVGIDDQIAQGMWITVRGMSASYLPWDAGQPDLKQQCVSAAMASSAYSDQRCSDMLPAACECEP